MKILVDADACPVKAQILKVAKEFNIRVIMFIDTSHILEDSYAEVVTVDKGRDSVDIALANKLEKGDVVVTQDYGVATLALAKSAKAMNQNGMIYDDKNIDQLLFERELSRKIRRTGRLVGKHKKREKQDDERFLSAFKKMCTE